MTQPAHFACSFNRSLLKTALVVGSGLFSGHALALAATGFPYAPGISVTGLSGDITTGYADAMVPVVGQSTQFFYLDPQGLFHNNDDYSASLGLGGRKLTEKSGILGAYVFGDYNHAPDGHGFWFVSPGIERLGNRIDFSANLYIPVGSDQVGTGTAFGNQLGIYDYVTFAGHTEYDQLFNTFESVGVGGDAEVGYRLPVKNNTKIYLGGYHFEPKNADNITGGALRLEIPFTKRLNVTVSDGYDNAAHNTFKAGLTYNFVGRHTALNFKGDLLERMVDPIHRNLMAVAGSAHTAQPIVSSSAATGQTGVVMHHISFFLPGGSGAHSSTTPDGTYENPYIGLNQGNVNDANTQGNNNFFFNGGLGPYTSDTQINMFGNNVYDNVYGRQSYQGRLFVQPAQGDNRPVLDFASGGLNWTINAGNANIVVSSVAVTGSGESGISFTNNGSGTVSMAADNIDVSNTNFGLTIFVENQSSGVVNLAVNNSTVDDNTNSGLFLLEEGQGGVMNVAVDNSTFNGNGGDGIGAFMSGATNPTFNLAINSSSLDNNGGNGMNLNDLSNGGSTMNIAISNSSFNGNDSTSEGEGAGLAVAIGGNTNDTVNIAIDHSQFNNNFVGGVYVNDSGGINTALSITANNSTFDGNEHSGLEIGVAQAAASILVNNSTFNGNGGYGIGANNDGSITLIANNSTFDSNGVDGIFANNDSGVFNLTTNNSSFSGNGNDGIYASNSSTFNLVANNSTFNNNTNWGIETSGLTSVSWPGSTFSGNGSGSTSINP